MTQEKTDRSFPVRDHSGTAETLARPLTDAERACELPCRVRHPSAGGPCARTAATMVYGLLFCEVHGDEATAGALVELYGDAADYLERLYNPHAPIPNAEAERVAGGAWRGPHELEVRYERTEEEALRRAYPTIPEHVCYETVAFDYSWDPENPTSPNDWPAEVYQDARRLLCKEMRLAYEEGADWLVEVLEHEREAASAQLAFALEDYERKTGSPYMGEARPRQDRVGEALGRINGALSEASDLLSESVPLEAFEDEEDYWGASRAIAQAGGIVVREQGRRQKGSAGDRPAE